MIEGEWYRDQVLYALKTAVIKAGSQTALASEIGISKQYLHDMLNERRGITGKALDFLGFQEMTIYIPIRERAA